ncbi:profilin [Streptomyces litmocidini]|uniref:profilin n=1 Tax=Streptomyces litmocidini TaxID=67318 RepID=UPI0033F0BB14
MAGEWQPFVDRQLIGSGQVAQAAIIDRSDGTVLAISPGFEVKSGEAAAIFNLFKEPSRAFSAGATVNGVKYTVFQATPPSIYSKNGANGAILFQTGKVVLIGVYDRTQQPGNAAQAVEKLGYYLLDNGM